MKTVVACVLAVLLLLSCSDVTNRTKNSPLSFTADSTFKIVQFTDIHYDSDSPTSHRTQDILSTVLDIEKPQLVILTGDIVTSKPAETGWRAVTQPMIERDMPWAATLGNHDDEYDLSRQQIIALLSELPYSLVQAGPASIGGGGNYVLEINNPEQAKTEALIYCQDSNAYSTIDSLDSYGWFTFPQIQWYREQSAAFTAANENQPFPALAFFHIPLPEYNLVWDSPEIQKTGVKNEDVCSPVLNSGMFTAMLESGDVMATFVGHDHVNDYIGLLHGMALAYGRASGWDSYGELEKGARVIELKMGERVFETWIRTGRGEALDRVQYPKSFETTKTEK